jgi:hypothetical protein
MYKCRKFELAIFIGNNVYISFPMAGACVEGDKGGLSA